MSNYNPTSRLIENQKPKSEAKSIFTLYEERDVEAMKKDGIFQLIHYDEPTNDDYFVKKTKILTQKPEMINRLYFMEPIIKFPISSISFNEKIYNLIKETFDAKTNGVYNPNEAKNCCRLVTDKARALAKSLKFERYKYVINTIVLQKLGQSVLVTSAATSSPSSDGYVCQKYETKEFVVICIFYAIYHE